MFVSIPCNCLMWLLQTQCVDLQCPAFLFSAPIGYSLASMEPGMSSSRRPRFPGWDDLAQMYEQPLPPGSRTSGTDVQHLDAATPAPSAPASEQLIPTIPLDPWPTRAGGPGTRLCDNSAFDVAFETILTLCRDARDQARVDPTIPKLAEFFLSEPEQETPLVQRESWSDAAH